jgi:hypothetical protein
MSAQTASATTIFRSSRRRSHGLLAGVLLVLGYFGVAAVLIRDYSVPTVSVDRIA